MGRLVALGTVRHVRTCVVNQPLGAPPLSGLRAGKSFQRDVLAVDAVAHFLHSGPVEVLLFGDPNAFRFNIW